MGEQKHKIFKQHAPHTNSKENDLQLLQAINLSQTLRYTIDGMYRHHPQWGNVSSVLEDVLEACPRLREYIVGKPRAPTVALTTAGEKATVDHEGSEFEYARVGKRIAARDNQKNDDAANIAENYASLYGTNLRLLSKWNMKHWRSFTGTTDGLRQKIYAGRSIIKIKNQNQYAINTFALINRIITTEVGQMARVIFEIVILRRSTEEEYWAAPYEVYSLLNSDRSPLPCSYIGVREVVPGRYHFVSKIENTSWYWNHLIIQTN